MAALIERKGIYYAQFYDEGRRPPRKRISLRTDKERIAQRQLLRLEDDYAAGKFDPWTDDPWSYDQPDFREARLKEAREEYLAEKRSDGLRPDTLRTYREVVTLFEDVAGKATWMTAITGEDIRRFVRESGLAPATQFKRYGQLRIFIRWCLDEGLLRENPLEAVTRPRKPDTIPKAVTEEELGRICSAICEDYRDKRDRGCIREGQIVWRVPLFRFALYTGMRASELARLRWEHIDFARGLVYIYEQKNGREQTIPLTNKAREALEGVERGEPGDYVFQSPSFDQETRSAKNFRERASRAFRKGRKLAGIDRQITFHSLRHGFCTLLAEKGKSAFVIKEAARHASVQTSQRYVSIANRRLKDEINDAFGD